MSSHRHFPPVRLAVRTAACIVASASLLLAPGARAEEPSTAQKVGSAASSAVTKTGKAVQRGGEKVEGALEKGGSSDA